MIVACGIDDNVYKVGEEFISFGYKGHKIERISEETSRDFSGCKVTLYDTKGCKIVSFVNKSYTLYYKGDE